MDGISGVTWSQVAAKAFELEVTSRTMGKDNDDMTAAIERLKASEQEDRAFGLEHGKIWAMNAAEWAELCAVTGIREHTEDDEFTHVGMSWKNLGTTPRAYTTFSGATFAAKTAAPRSPTPKCVASSKAPSLC
jgi:hypothetical protein